MKRMIIILAAAAMLAGCAEGESPQSEVSIEKQSVPVTEDYTVTADAIEVCGLDRQAIIDILDKQSNFKAATDIVINIPERAAVLEYTTRTPMIPDWPQDYDELYSAFKETFAYWFPEKELDEDCLYYVGKDSHETWDEEGQQTSFLRKVKDDNGVLAGSEGGSVYLEYDEGRGKEDKTGCLEFNFGPDPELECVGTLDRRSFTQSEVTTIETLPPDSEKRFKLSDKEISVTEAVRFFEEKVNGSPYPKKPNCRVCVASVEVFRTGEDTYGFLMFCSKDIGGILTEVGSGGGSFYGDKKYDILMPSYGYMLRSDEIEMFQCCNPTVIIEDAASYSSICTFEEAAERISSELTSEVTFEVKRAELCYCQQAIRTEQGYLDINGYPARVLPVWRLTLFNPNDLNTYFCYVSADGKEFSYWAKMGGTLE